MSVVLFILKLIGIILLALLGIILLLALLVLLVPVRYHVSGQIEDEITIHAKANWLLHLISFHADYEGKEFASGLHILGIRMKAKSKSALEEEDWEDEEQEADEADDTAAGNGATEDIECDDLNDGRTGKESEPVEVVHSGEERRTQRQKSLFDGLRSIKETATELLKKGSSLKALITDEANQMMLLAVLAELKYLFKHFRFRKLITDLRFSLGDPAATGQALGVLSMFPVLYQYQVSIIPDFESEEFYVKGVFEIKGRMRVVHFVVSLARLWKKKEVRFFVKKLLNR